MTTSDNTTLPTFVYYCTLHCYSFCAVFCTIAYFKNCDLISERIPKKKTEEKNVPVKIIPIEIKLFGQN